MKLTLSLGIMRPLSGNGSQTLMNRKKMRKFSSFMAAAVAMLAAVSCNKEINNIDPVTPGADAVVYTAYVDGAETKTSLGAYDEVNDKTAAQWDANDQITIHNGTKGYTFTTTDSGSSATFTTTEEGFAATEVMAVYPAGDYAVDVENKTVNASIPTWQQAQIGTYHSPAALAVAYSEDNTLQFKNATALLKFTVNTDNVTHVVFHGNKEEAITGNVQVTLGAEGVVVTCLQTEFTETQWNEELQKNEEVKVTKFGTWVECYAVDDECLEKGKTYYLAVAPNTFEEGVTVKVRINKGNELIAKSTTKRVETKANTILDLGVIEYFAPAPVPSDYGLVGSFQGWDPAHSIEMVEATDGWLVTKNIELYKDSEFKFVKGATWDVSYGAKDEVLVADGDIEYTLVAGGQNIKVSQNGKHDIYFNPTTLAFKYSCVEEYTGNVVITINNKANWSPLYITLWDGANEIVKNATVTDNKYDVSLDYVGRTLTCQLSDGSKTSEKMNVLITKDGAAVTLEETIVKLYVQLDTANSKQWWGNTMKIHAWNTGTSFDTSWPGNTMTSEGNYTWSIIVPSELVGKTVNFLVHNGNGWQSNDAKVTIAANGSTVKGSTIGIN